MPIDRFDEIALKVHRGDVMTVTFYYGPLSSARYPLRLDFEVQKWPPSANLRGFAYSFTSVWLDNILLPLQSSEIKWYKMTVRIAGQYYQVPLVGKYGRLEGVPASDRLFGVSLIPRDSAKTTKTFRIRGVADVYEQFDRPDNKDPEIEGRSRTLEQALVSSFPLVMGDTVSGVSLKDEAILRYVRIPSAKRKEISREQGGRVKIAPIQFTAAFCIGFQ